MSECKNCHLGCKYIENDIIITEKMVEEFGMFAHVGDKIDAGESVICDCCNGEWRNCPQCRARMAQMNELARNAEHPEVK